MRAVNEPANITDRDHLPWVCFCPCTNAGIFLTHSHRPVRCVPYRLHSGLDLMEKEVYKQANQFLQLIEKLPRSQATKARQVLLAIYNGVVET